MDENENIVCPVCNNATKKIKRLGSPFIEKKLSDQFRTQITADLGIIDYELLKCNECGFEFAFPQVEGSGAFYDWVTSQPNYYVESRWEYSKMLELLSKETKKIKLLDVGCGDGQFFDAIVQSENYHVDFYGLDPTSGSVAICKRKGYRVFCMDIRQFKSAYRDDLFDVITAYHVLEHIADPKSFLKELSGLINETGAIYISTPYSPMDFELQWYDVLNHPPHHMGRWNLASYKKLAATLGLKLEIFVPEPAGILKTAVISFLFSIYGPSKIKSKFEILRGVIKHPFQFLNHLYNQCKREKIKGKRASNVILAKFSKNETSNYIESA